jgi:hypothetical protein
VEDLSERYPKTFAVFLGNQLEEALRSVDFRICILLNVLPFARYQSCYLGTVECTT